MPNPVDRFLNTITMYRLVLYGLLLLLAVGGVVSATGAFSFTLIQLLTSVGILIVICYATNWLLATAYRVLKNSESALISALIIACVITPATTTTNLLAVVAVGILAMLSKYVFAINRKHIFNPVAIGVVVAGLLDLTGASWWVGSSKLVVFTAILGFLIVRKTRRVSLVNSFIVVSLAGILWLGVHDMRSFREVLLEAFTSTPLIFFATVMLTEPLTMPPTKKQQVIYGATVGLLFASRWMLGPFYSSPALALVLGNCISYVMSPKHKPELRLQERRQLTNTLYTLILLQLKNLLINLGNTLSLPCPIASRMSEVIAAISLSHRRRRKILCNLGLKFLKMLVVLSMLCWHYQSMEW